MGSYRTLIENKEKLILTMKKSNETFIPVDFSPIDEQFHQLADAFHVTIYLSCYLILRNLQETLKLILQRIRNPFLRFRRRLRYVQNDFLESGKSCLLFTRDHCSV